MKTCPKCKELLGVYATKCPECGYIFTESDSISYVCQDCGESLPYAYSICHCGGRATSIHHVEETIDYSYDKLSRFDWLFNKKI